MIASRLGPDVLPMRRNQRSVLAIIVVGLVLTSGGVAGAAQTSTSVRLTNLDKALLIQINVVRRAHALRPVKLSTLLSNAANKHTTDMGQAGYFSHTSLDRTVFWKRIARSYPTTGHRSWSVGENLLFASPDIGAAEAIGLWMNSPGHRANLLDPKWREVGIATRHFDSAAGIYGNQPVSIVTTDFGVRR